MTVFYYKIYFHSFRLCKIKAKEDRNGNQTERITSTVCKRAGSKIPISVKRSNNGKSKSTQGTLMEYPGRQRPVQPDLVEKLENLDVNNINVETVNNVILNCNSII